MTAGCPSAHVVYFCAAGARKARTFRRRLLRADDLEEEVGEEDVEDAGDGHAEGGEADEQRPVPGRARDSTGDTSRAIACVRGERGQLQRDGAAHHSMLSTASTVQAMERPHQAPVCPAVRGWRAGGVRWAGQRVVYMRCEAVYEVRCEAVYEDYQAARSTVSGKRRTRA